MLDTVPNNLQDLLEQLISGDPHDPNYANIVPQSEVETEVEWELLEGGKDPKEKMQEDQVGEDDKVIIRRYEFYKYTGAVDEENGPISLWETLGNPSDPGLDVFDDEGGLIFAAERGDFISANMVAAVLVPVPEPSTSALIAVGLVLAWMPCATTFVSWRQPRLGSPNGRKPIEGAAAMGSSPGTRSRFGYASDNHAGGHRGGLYRRNPLIVKSFPVASR